MHIAFVNSTHKWGGVKTWYLELAAFLAGRGHRVSLFARPGPFLDKARALGLDAAPFAFGPDMNPLAVGRFARFVRSREVHCVICNVGKDMRTAGLAARLCGIPVIQRIGSEGDLKNRAKTRLEMRFYGQTLFTVCEDIKSKLLDKLPFLEPERVRVLYTGKAPLPSPPKGPVPRPLRLITTSQLVTCKGIPTLLRGLRTLLDRGVSLHYTALGNGPQEEELRTLCTRLGLDAHVDWKGFTTDVPGELMRADVFLLPSLEEGVPQGLMEAMAHGLVPVASRVGGIPEIWPPALPSEFLVPLKEDGGPSRDEPEQGNVDGFVRALDKVCRASDKQLRSWGDTAWAHVSAHLSADHCLARIEQEIESIIRNRGWKNRG